MREIEIKLRAPDLAAIATKLQELGASISDPVTQEDINFVHKDDVRWFEPGTKEWVYPRLRLQNGTCTFTVKKPITNEMDCIEHELQVSDPEALKAILVLFEYRQSVTVKKTRRTCTLKHYTITLDEVEHLGSFIEIEQVVIDGDAEALQKEMFQFAKETFGLEQDAQTMLGYDILLHAGESSATRG